MYKVYAKHKDNLVYHIYSTCFEDIQENDIFIKQGDGDDFVHVGYYQVYDENMCHRYKIVDNQMVETEEEERLLEFESNKSVRQPTDVEILQQQMTQLIINQL